MTVLIARKYKCLDCQETGKLCNVIKRPTDIQSEFVLENIESPETINANSLYTYKLERDDYGILGRKLAYKMQCEHCASKNIERVPEQEFNNVMNFYPPAEAEKWYNHLN